VSKIHPETQLTSSSDVSLSSSIEPESSRLPSGHADLPFIVNEEMISWSRSGFVALSAWLVRKLAPNAGVSAEFPLRGLISLRSNISLVFSDREVHACSLVHGRCTLWLNVLTLGGINGVLPLRITEDILAAARHGGESLHEFLDLLNRRFWELLFQSYRIGTRPQFGFQDTSARRMVQELAASYVGLRNTGTPGYFTSSVNYKAYLVRYGFHAGRGSGGQAAVAELLSHTIGAPVVLSDRIACKLPVPRRYHARLGTSADGLGLGNSSILGGKASIHQKLLMDACVPATELASFYPLSCGHSMCALLSALNMALAGRIAAVAARYKVLCDPAHVAGLGQATCRLAWGAALGGGALHTRFIHISNAAVLKIRRDNDPPQRHT
jgi:predicted component of type VI protein secretion system